MCDNRRISQLEADLQYWRQKAIDLENSLELADLTAGRVARHGQQSSRSFEDALSALDESDGRQLAS